MPAAPQEIRIAMALNGGVSLAVWMGGCAVELDRARLASAAGKEPPRIYDALCACFGRRLVIDILSGASAGGINGALLSAAMVRGRKLDVEFVRNQWLDLGDLGDLLYPAAKEDPPALMDGELFHKRLLRAFEGVLGVNPKAPGFKACATSAEVKPMAPSLDVTMTDVIGVEKRFPDAWGGLLIAREHRPRFKFREGSHFSAAALAAAARTSASFPVAFEPWPVRGGPQVLAGLPRPTYGIDGGLLDNAPIKAALDLIPSKRADSRVLRYVCYLNGDPVLPGDELSVTAPKLPDVGGYMINLPRAAPFVDQLYAIKRAVERPQLTENVQLPLLGMDLQTLSEVARGLFDAYRQRRTMESLEELLGDPGEASATMALLDGTDGSLPWIPISFGPDSTPVSVWRWGVRPAQRILHLLLDLLRPEIRQADDELRPVLRGVRDTIDGQLEALDTAREQVLAFQNENNPSTFEQEAPLERLQKAVEAADAEAPTALAAVQAAATAFRAAIVAHRDALGASPAAALFGDATDDGEWLPLFLRRVLAIEVIRRAFAAEAEIESAQELRFVQLTPAAPSPIFTAGPLRLPSPNSATEKLAGVGIGHFAGFYRRSWRANDFMWGRLDAAARIVDLLLDCPADGTDVGSPEAWREEAEKRSACLVDTLLPEDGENLAQTREWLLQEALDDAATTDGTAPKTASSTAELKEWVRERIEAELTAAGPGGAQTGMGGMTGMPFTRAVFQRAAQLEIVIDELPVIRQETSDDSKLGSAVKPFPKESKERDLIAEIEAVRAIYEDGDSLPHRLTNDEEAVSDLGLRTITHATFVALSAVRTAGAPLSKFFGVVRTPLSAIAATVAESRVYRIAAVFGFWAAAVYLTSRLVATDADAALSFSSIWSWATLTALVAVLGLIGFAAVPVLRVWREVRPLRNFLLASGLLGFAFGFVAVWAAIIGFDIERILFAPGVDNPPKLVLLAPLAGLGTISVARLPLPGWLSKLAHPLEKLRKSRLFYLPLVATFILLGIWTGIDLWEAGFDGGAHWQLGGALFAIFATPIVAAVSLTRLKRPRLRLRLGSRRGS
jgi:predicted acylesterase/phospholipase RssA